MIYQIIYGSSAKQAFSSIDLVELLRKARVNNSRLGVTGMLLYHDGNFLQILEGEQADVQALLDLISRDTRHSGVLIFYRGYSAEREFGEWSMAFHAVTEQEWAGLGSGFRQVKSLTDGETQSIMIRMFLRSFRRLTRIEACP